MTVYPALCGGTRSQGIGGAEIQQVQIARLLNRMGHDVSFVTTDHGQEDGGLIEGFRVFKAYAPEAGLPGLRYVHPRWTSMWRAIERAQADVYYSRGAGLIPGMLALMKRRRRLRYVFAAASDSDFQRRHPRLRFARDRWLFRLGVMDADAVIVQSETQRQLLEANFGRDGIVVPNFMDAEPIQLKEAQRTDVLWVGRMTDIKRPLMFVDLARSLPDLSFVMIGPRVEMESDLYAAVEKATQDLPNLRFLGFRPFDEVELHFDHCRVLVSTSPVEGFPNVFLQAMRRGIPIVSFVDLDGMIARNRLGAVVVDEAQLRAKVSELSVSCPEDGARIRRHFLDNFGVRALEPKYRALLSQISA